ncbi:MAG TPA: lysylphosphatidylglycerol synthase transmembrane domain-containing protein [Solirubrobacteraceae bacterium]|nr:lysylphosphatidylglycerol synthase transmembrane domain-containing protein [Solirubrobacteraceae bacterium]
MPDRIAAARSDVLEATPDSGSEERGPDAPEKATLDELAPKRLRRRLLELTALAAAVVVFVLTGPGLGTLRHDVEHASVGWLGVGIGLETLSALSYVVIFRAVFCPRMPWRLTYQLGMSEQGANSVLSVSGAGGLALGAWALKRGGMSAEQIGRKTVAFFFLTSLPNVAGVILFAALYATGLLGHDRDPGITYAFGAAALIATVFVLALPRLLKDTDEPDEPTRRGRIARALHFARSSLRQGVRDAVLLVRGRSAGVLLGALGTMVFDMAVLGVCFRAFGHEPPVGVLVLGYLIGQLGGNLPTPGGIGGVDLGLVGMFTLYHQPLAVSTAAVLTYHAISLWVPGLLGSLAFVQLRRTLRREEQPEVICRPLAEPIVTVPVPGG